MLRRSLLAAPALLPALAHAQSSLPLIGVLRVGGPSNEQFAPVFKRDLARLGWEDGKTYRTQYAFAEGNLDKLPALARELVSAGARIIVPFGNEGTEAAQGATREVAIVAMADDLVAWKLVPSMARPNGNTTGVSVMAHELDAKRTEVLHEMVPQARRVAVVIHEAATIPGQLETVLAGAKKFGLEPVMVQMNSSEAYPQAVSRLEAEKVDAVQFLASPLLNALRGRFIGDLARLKLPGLYEWPESVEEGGLLAYGPRIALCYRHLSVLVSRVLKGAKPADLPVEQPSTFVLALNAGAARKIGLAISDAMLLRADLVVD